MSNELAKKFEKLMQHLPASRLRKHPDDNTVKAGSYIDDKVQIAFDYFSIGYSHGHSDARREVKRKKLSRRILFAIRQLRRENGTECVFSKDLIYKKVGGDKYDFLEALNFLVRCGEVFFLDDCYRLN